MFHLAVIHQVVDDAAEGNGVVLVERDSCSRIEFASFDGLGELKLGHEISGIACYTGY
jgi:hypothetical protein